MIGYAPFLVHPKYRLAQGTLPPYSFGPTAADRVVALRKQIEDLVAIYSNAHYDSDTRSRLSDQIRHCFDLIDAMPLNRDDAAAEAAARACITNLDRTLEAAAKTGSDRYLADLDSDFKTKLTVLGVFAAASAGVSAYHGYKRNNNSAGWAAWWGLMGFLFPVVTPVVAITEGYGKPGK